jgi:Ni,Fe-hydrogenase III large subunit
VPAFPPFRRSAHSAPATSHPFFQVQGAGVHEVAVGPVHAGIIEPGHFRFQCSGETVHHLEIHLGYQHRGAEALLRDASPARRMAVAETIAGDTSIGHGVAYCRAMESLAGVEVPETALWLRAIALELERLANHVGDLGALCNDVGFLPGASWFGRLRGEFLNATMEIAGNRFGRGLLTLGGVRMGVPMELRRDLLGRLAVARRDLEDVAALTFESPSVLSRFEHAGVVSRATAQELGLVGPVARASGCTRDVRCDHPLGAFVEWGLAPSVETTGDVLARARVRWLEIGTSLEFVLARLAALPDGPLTVEVPPARPGALVAVLVEGWRGEILHVAATGDDGNLNAYRVFDPSLRNWFGLTMALRGNPISDFPLCNKSFNLSYSGHDV